MCKVYSIFKVHTINALKKANEILTDKDRYLAASIEGFVAAAKEAQEVVDNPGAEQAEKTDSF